MFRTPRPRPRAVSSLAAAAAAAVALAVAGAAPLAIAEESDAATCAASDTRVYVRMVDGAVSVSARYWNGSQTEPVTVESPKTVKWTIRRSDAAVTVRPARGLVPLGGFMHVDNPDGGPGSITDIEWDGVVVLTPTAGTSYELCGDDPARDSVPWPY